MTSNWAKWRQNWFNLDVIWWRLLAVPRDTMTADHHPLNCQGRKHKRYITRKGFLARPDQKESDQYCWNACRFRIRSVSNTYLATLQYGTFTDRPRACLLALRITCYFGWWVALVSVCHTNCYFLWSFNAPWVANLVRSGFGKLAVYSVRYYIPVQKLGSPKPWN